MIRLCVALAMALLVLSCATEPAPQSQGEAFQSGQSIPVDAKIYHISGAVVSDVDSIVSQKSPGGGYLRTSGQFSYGTFFGPSYTGKGMVRLLVTASDTRLAPTGSVVILKVEDSKASALLPGDIVSMKCRVQYEALSAVVPMEILSEDGVVSELDYCRMITPEVKIGD